MHVNKIWSELEKWDKTPVFQIIFSLEGGFGSRFLKNFADNILSDSPSAELITHILYPDLGTGIYPGGLGLYNSVEGMSHWIELPELSFIYDNQGLSKINKLLYPQDYIQKTNLGGYELEWERNNKIVADYISDLTSVSRFPLYSSSCYKKIATNMVQFPRIHFLSGFLSPLNMKLKKEDWIFDDMQNVESLFKNLHDYNLSFSSFIELRTKDDLKNHTNIESALLNSSGIFRLSDESEISEIELKYQYYCQNNNTNSTHIAFSDETRENAWTGENYSNHAAFTVNSHAMK